MKRERERDILERKRERESFEMERWFVIIIIATILPF
jgi:hypothetical protein